jgi:hypothetical protein
MDRVFSIFDPKTNSTRFFQGVELRQTNKNYHRISGNFVDGSNEEVIVLVDGKSVIQGYEEGNRIVMEPTSMTPPHTRKTRSDKGKPRGKMSKKKAAGLRKEKP